MTCSEPMEPWPWTPHQSFQSFPEEFGFLHYQLHVPRHRIILVLVTTRCQTWERLQIPMQHFKIGILSLYSVLTVVLAARSMSSLILVKQRHYVKIY